MRAAARPYLASLETKTLEERQILVERDKGEEWGAPGGAFRRVLFRSTVTSYRSLIDPTKGFSVNINSPGGCLLVTDVYSRIAFHSAPLLCEERYSRSLVPDSAARPRFRRAQIIESPPRIAVSDAQISNGFIRKV